MRLARACGLVAAVALIPARSRADDAEPAYSATVTIEKPFSAASSSIARDEDFLLAPRHTPTDILRAVPGLVLAQHQGGGKADQLFLRGFDADHGTDVAISLDGVPVNLVSHAHGQGFADLHFLIPEVIERLEITKGPYFAELGDFDTAGAVNLVTRSKFDSHEVSITAGSFDTWRALGIAAPALGGMRTFLAGEVYGTQGPFVMGENLRRYNLFAKATTDLSPTTTLSLLATSYAVNWRSSGQVPARLVDAGVISRFGAVDPSEGGSTRRNQAILTLTNQPHEGGRLRLTLSTLRYDMQLFNNFTFQKDDPVNGDAIEQGDARWMLFADARYERRDRAGPLPGSVATSLGASWRHDGVEGALWSVRNRERLSNCGAASNPCVGTIHRQDHLALHAQADWRAFTWLRFVAGLRYDALRFIVSSTRDDGRLEATDPVLHAPLATAGQLSPKASVVISPDARASLFVNFGRGFHSNDARSAVQTSGAGALASALGYEVGVKWQALETLRLSAALWRLDLSSELVWSGDAGTTEPSFPSRREGLDVEWRWQALPWLFADADLMFSRGRFQSDRETGNAIALAPTLIVTGGLTARHPSGIHGSMRLRHIGDRPATELMPADGVPACTSAMDASDPGLSCFLVAKGYTVMDLQVGYAAPAWSLTLAIENLTNSAYREAQFGNDSRVITAPPRAAEWAPEPHAIRDVHFTPGNPLGAQVTLGSRF